MGADRGLPHLRGSKRPHDVFYEVIEDDTVTVLHTIARALYRSRDGGATWQQLAEVDGTDSFRQISMLVLQRHLVIGRLP